MDSVHMGKFGYLRETVPAPAVRNQSGKFSIILRYVRVAEKFEILGECKADSLGATAEPDQIGIGH